MAIALLSSALPWLSTIIPTEPSAILHAASPNAVKRTSLILVPYVLLTSLISLFEMFLSKVKLYSSASFSFSLCE